MKKIILIVVFVGFASLLYSQTAEAHYNIAKQEIVDKNYDDAILHLTKAIELNPKYDKAYYNRGKAKILSGQLEEGILDLNKVISLNPTYALAYHLRGYAKLGLKKYSEAISDYTKLIALYPTFVRAYMERGFAKKQLGDYSGAIKDYDAGIKMSPNTGPETETLYNNRSIAKSLLGDEHGSTLDSLKSEELQRTKDSTQMDCSNSEGGFVALNATSQSFPVRKVKSRKEFASIDLQSNIKVICFQSYYVPGSNGTEPLVNYTGRVNTLLKPPSSKLKMDAGGRGSRIDISPLFGKTPLLFFSGRFWEPASREEAVILVGDDTIEILNIIVLDENQSPEKILYKTSNSVSISSNQQKSKTANKTKH